MSQEMRAAEQRWTVVLTTKSATIGKSRLAPYAGHRRPDLARAMALDTIAAAMRCAIVTEVVVVTSDLDSARAFATIGARVVPDTPDQGLNTALSHGVGDARLREPERAVAGLQADLPALRAADLGRALRAAAAAPTAFVADAARVGTTLYTASSGSAFMPGFGPASRNAHLATGAVELALAGLDSLRRDVDTEADLRAAVELGLGPRTLGVLESLAKEPSPSP